MSNITLICTHREGENSAGKGAGGDDVGDDSELAFSAIGSLFGPATAAIPSPAK